MLKRDLIKAVYSELRASSAGTEVAAIDLLQLAQHIVRAYTDPDSILENDQVERDWRAFHQIEVDKAMSDGGWRVYIFEYQSSSPYRDTSAEGRTAQHARLEKFLGPQWRHQAPMGRL